MHSNVIFYSFKVRKIFEGHNNLFFQRSTDQAEIPICCISIGYQIFKPFFAHLAE